ncbi:MAG: Na+/H+ antiporter NhaC family protein [Maledivibacter sp.]|jgi:Na+/H+ antiporter NhaC|nr:Na+/H+ antiporter NhaC family protein [Maledivibacter sp.]
MKRRIFISTLLCILLTTTISLAVDPEVAQANADKYGLLTLLPPLIAITLAFITKNVVLSLFVGVFSGTFLIALNTNNLFGAFIHGFLNIVQQVLSSLADSWNAGIILQCLAIGGLIGVISKMGGARAVAESLAKKAKTPVSAQIITWVLGLIVFFDDYANSLIVGPIMRPVTDKFQISRERLAFIIDGTAAPIAGIALISTWVGYEIGLIRDAYSSIGQNINAYGIFMQTIPYRFYNILILVFIVATSITLKEFGPMYKAEKRARTTGKLLPDGASIADHEKDDSLEPKKDIVLSVWNAIIPIGVLIITAFLGFYFNGYGALDEATKQLVDASPISMLAIRETFGASDASIVLFQAALIASVVAIIMASAKKILTVSEAIDTWIQGTKSLVITGVILLLAWSLSSTIKELGTAKFLVSVLSDSIPAFLLPSIIFILGSIISFATGTSYGTMGILMPLAIPLAHAISPETSYVVMSAGAVLTGAIFGDHCSPISDTTILSSMGASCDHLEHVKTQLYYAITVGGISVLFGYIPVGLGLSIIIALPLSMAAIIGAVIILGKRVPDAVSNVEQKIA